MTTDQPTAACTERITVVLATYDFARVVAVAHLWCEPSMLGDHDALHDVTVQVARTVADRTGVADARGGVAPGHVPLAHAGALLAVLRAAFRARSGVPHRTFGRNPN